MFKTNGSIRTFRYIFAMASLLLLAGAVFAQTEQEDRTLSPYFFVQGDPSIDHLPLKDTKVDVAVSGVIADVKVVQTYKNEGRRPINASYVFPASTRAAVYSMRMRIGNEVIVARIKEREEARQEFEVAKREGKSASLLEEERPNVFSMSMANLMPNEEIEIELKYTELLIPTKGVYEFVYPTVVGPRYAGGNGGDKQPEGNYVNTPYFKEGKKPTSTFDINAVISAGMPIQNLACPSHRVVPEWKDPNTAGLSLGSGDAHSGNKDFILRYSLAGNQIASGLLLFEGKDENFFLYMAQPPSRVNVDDIPPREYVFLVDVSGSMDGFPLDTSKQLLEDLIGNLRPNDFFNVVLFAGDSTRLSDQPLQASKANVSRAIQLLEEQRGFGGTELLEGMKDAMSLPRRKGVSRSIVLVTDGYVYAEEGVFTFIRENLNKTNVFAFGIGSSVNRYLIDGVAMAGMGEPFVVAQIEDAASVAADFREYIQSPVLTDISVTPVGFDTYDVFPTQLPDLFSERPVIVYGKWRGPVSGTIGLRGVNGNGDWVQYTNVAGVKVSESNRALRYLWARNRIAELSDYNFSGAGAANREEIVNLGLKYNLLTRYTSFIAVRELISNPDGSAANVRQPLPLPVGVGNLAIGSEPEMIWLLAAAALAGLVLVVVSRFIGMPGNKSGEEAAI